jgi:hypothetical protein
MSANYWSATEYSTTNAWNQNFSSGNQNNNNKTNTYRVRAVRRQEAVHMQCDMTVEELFAAYYDCRRTKRNTWNALTFEECLERNLMGLYHELRSGEYRPGRSLCFVVTHPKPREVWAADFRDRVVHHLLYNRVSDRFHRAFIHDSYACIPGRGTLMAAARVEAMIRSATEDHSRPAWFLKADIANFFVSIDKPVLDTLLAARITEPWWMDLCRRVLHHDPVPGAVIRSGEGLLRRIPPHKSLFNAGGSRGLPIGNLSSQFFANVYLDRLDQHAKHALRLRHYGRYVDDIVVIGHDGGELHNAFLALAAFVRRHLHLEFHPRKTSINRVERGVNFVGHVIRPHARYIRRSTVRQIHRKLADPALIADRDRLLPTVNSYFGMFRHAAAWRERERLAAAIVKLGYRVDRALTKMTSPRRRRRRRP